MEKSVDAFRTISEVADELDLPQHVLRFWETRFTQIRPLKRAGGRRYYRPADVVLLRSIRQLLYDDGYTIKGVQRLLKDKARPRETGLRDGDLEPTLDAGGPAAEGGVETPDDLEEASSPADDSEHVVAPTMTGALVNEGLQAALSEIEECRRILADVLGRSA